jgi:hypothetical protein
MRVQRATGRARFLPCCACLIASAWLLVGCVVARDHYDTLADARAERLFERGWLPDVLPASATDIHVANDLENSTSTGSFDYRVGDDTAMLATMVPAAPEHAPFEDWADIVAKRRADGMLPWTYDAEFEAWVFFCDRNAGRCETWLWQHRARRLFETQPVDTLSPRWSPKDS